MYLTKTSRRRTDGTVWHYYILRDTIWDKKLKRQRHIYRAYIGPYPVITEAKARTIAKKLGCSLEDLRRVRRLKIIPGGEREHANQSRHHSRRSKSRS